MPRDLEKQKIAQAQHYQNNKDKYRESTKKTRAKRSYILQKLKAGGCIYCGEKHIGCLDFHHPNADDKNFGINIAKYRLGIQALIDEAKKCEVVCANCHRKIHWKEIHPDNIAGLIIEPDIKNE